MLSLIRLRLKQAPFQRLRSASTLILLRTVGGLVSLGVVYKPTLPLKKPFGRRSLALRSGVPDRCDVPRR